MNPSDDFQDENEEDLDKELITEEETEESVREIMAERGVEREEAERLLKMKNEFDLGEGGAAEVDIEE